MDQGCFNLTMPRLALGALVLIGILLAACGSSGEEDEAGAKGSAETVPAGALDPERSPIAARLAAELDAQRPPREPFLPSDASRTPLDDLIIRDDARPALFGFGWGTNFGIRIVGFDEFTPRVLRDLMAPLTNPRYITVGQAERFYIDGSPMIHFEVNGDVRAYPLEILLWHEVVNDVVGGVPVVVTYCPLCNTALAFDRRLGDVTLQFGTSGLLRRSDLIMYDRGTETLWQQIGGKALVGDWVGARLTPLPSAIVSWAQFREQFPDALVLSRDTGTTAMGEYGTTPYTAYDRTDLGPDSRRLFTADTDPRLPVMARVVGLRIGDEAVAYPFTFLAEEQVFSDRVGGQSIVIFWTPGAQSVLDRRLIDNSREVGATGVFLATVDGQALDFAANPRDPLTFIDRQTGSRWNVFGVAEAGEFLGDRLTPLVHANHFWFAWSRFEPETEVVEAS